MPKPKFNPNPQPIPHKPEPAPDRSLVTLYFTTAYQQFENDPVMLASIQSGMPSNDGISRLPGDTPEAKVAYLIAYLVAGAAYGCSGADMIDERHDSGLNLARPLYRGVHVTDPALAAKIYFSAGGIGIDLIKHGFANELANDPNWNFFTAPGYRNFWQPYGMP